MNFIDNTPLILIVITLVFSLIGVIREHPKSISEAILIMIIMLIMFFPLLVAAFVLWKWPHANESMHWWRSVIWLFLESVLALIQAYFWIGTKSYQTGSQFDLHIIIAMIGLAVFAVMELCVYGVTW